MQVVERDQGLDEKHLGVVYEELKSIASRLLRGDPAGETLQTTALVHELVVKWWGKDVFDEVEADREGFLRLAARSMRNLLCDRARAKSTRKRDGGARVPFDDALGLLEEDPETLLWIHELVDQVANDESLDEAPRKADVARYKIFTTYGDKEIARLVGASLATMYRDWQRVRAWLQERLSAGSGPRAAT